MSTEDRGFAKEAWLIRVLEAIGWSYIYMVVFFAAIPFFAFLLVWRFAGWIDRLRGDG